MFVWSVLTCLSTSQQPSSLVCTYIGFFYLVGIEMTSGWSHVASYPSHFIAGYKIGFCFYGNSVWETTVWATFICSYQNETTCDVWLCVMGQLCSHNQYIDCFFVMNSFVFSRRKRLELEEYLVCSGFREGTVHHCEVAFSFPPCSMVAVNNIMYYKLVTCK